jgi:hypothetical protein
MLVMSLRLGMYADVLAGTSSQGSATVIPRSAVQNVGERQVVYLVNSKEPGKFTEHEIRLGRPAGDRVEVLSGLKPGDVVVTEGSFFVRAERERLGLRPQSAAGEPRPHQTSDSKSIAEKTEPQRITVSAQAFEPSRLTLRAGVPARVTFVRTSDKTCATEVAFPSLKIKRPLPLNQPVVIEFTPDQAGEIVFVCGVTMLRGTVVVQ